MPNKHGYFIWYEPVTEGVATVQVFNSALTDEMKANSANHY